MTPDSHPFNATYVLAQIGWTLAGIALLVVVAVLWQRLERRIHAKEAARIVTFPTRTADVIPLHRHLDDAS